VHRAAQRERRRGIGAIMRDDSYGLTQRAWVRGTPGGTGAD
jgi:hypothetical protein